MAMHGGVGDYGYSQNSNLQAALFQDLAWAISTAIRHNSAVFADKKLIRIADIGCSSGTNTHKSVDFVMKEVIGLPELKDKNIVFQVYFSDLASNDFNTLFKLLADDTHISQGKPYFYSAVPGSFTERLFPSSSIHFCMSNFALHFLTKAPNPGTPAPEVVAAYAQQAHEDLCSFLSHRAEEIVLGGIISCFFIGKMSCDEEPTPAAVFLQEAWEELVSEGTIHQGSFHLKAYSRSLDEIQNAIEEFKDRFRTIRLEKTQVKGSDPKGNDYFKGLKAVSRGLVAEHFKDDENLIELFYKKLDNKVAAGRTSDFKDATHTMITLVLLRI